MITGAIAACCGAMMNHHHNDNEQSKREEQHKQELIDAENKRHEQVLNAINGTLGKHYEELKPKLDWCFEIFQYPMRDDFTETFNYRLNHRLEHLIDECSKINVLNLEGFDATKPKQYTNSLYTAEVLRLAKEEVRYVLTDFPHFDIDTLNRICHVAFQKFSSYGMKYAGRDSASSLFGY